MPDLSFDHNSDPRPSIQELCLKQQDTVAAQVAFADTVAAQAPLADAPGMRCLRIDPASETYGRLLSLLSAKDRERFLQSAERSATEALSILGQILVRERNRRNGRAAARFVSIFLFVIGVLVVAPWCWTTDYPVVAAMGVAIGVALPIANLAVRYNPVSRLERATLDYLLHLDDKRSVGVLLEQRSCVTWAERDKIQKALIQLLPQLDTADMAGMTPAQQKLLYDILDWRQPCEVELRLAVIAALERIGERRSFEPLYLLASGQAATKEEQTLRTAAQRGLYTLQSRVDFGGPEHIPNHVSRYGAQLDSQSRFVLQKADNLYGLLTLLPLLTPANYRQILSEAERDRLYALLTPSIIGTYSYDRLKLYREIVRTAERFRDTRAMSALRRMAAMEAPTDAERQVRTAAREALQVLRKQVEKEKVSKTLLRGSFAPEAQPDELLRPAAPTENRTDPEEMLRASTPEQPRGPITTASLAEAMKALRRQSQEDTGP
jgi:hypothetical protein